MAAHPFEQSHSGANYFSIFSDPAPRLVAPSGRLPSGPCNYVDLSLGVRCGCRRFWVRQNEASTGKDQSGWCMCNHHACYHDEGNKDNQQVLEPPQAEQENERPLSNGRQPLSPVLDLGMRPPPSFLVGLDGVCAEPAQPPTPKTPELPSNHIPRLSHIRTLTTPGSIPDTLSFGGPYQHLPNAMPPIPSQCVMSSQVPSVTSSFNTRYTRPFGGKGLETLRVNDRPNQPLVRHQSIAEDDKTQLNQPREDDACESASQLERLARDAGPQSSGVFQEALNNLSDQVSGHAQRLDRLETVPLSMSSHDDCHEKHDHMDLRITDLESKFEEMERNTNDIESVVGRQPVRTDETASVSAVSVATSLTTRPAHSQDLYSQIQTLKARVDQLQSFLPTHNRAWEVEVVVLPFPLKRIWQDIHDFKSDLSISSDDWTQLPLTHSSHTIRSQSPFQGDWSIQNHDAEWLLPRAFSDKHVIYRRLRSRGLIKTISVKGPDPRSVQSAMNSVFGDTFRSMQATTHSQGSDALVTQYLGLQCPWVPLRKIHKDSRLRFLSPAEMVSPAVWDVQFLNSVMMRSSEPRLFVTHPTAYLQDHAAYENGWSWQQIREMDRVYPDVTESQDIPEADALEECWAWNERLDEHPSAETSMSLRRERRVSSSPSVQHLPQPSHSRSTSPAMQSSNTGLRIRQGSRPPHLRTTSMPVAGHPQPSPYLARRRVVSSGTRRPSPLVQSASIMKSHGTRSPSLHTHFTPRWTVSPSPGPPGPMERQNARGTTPFTYATPASNRPPQDLRIRGSSVTRTVADAMDAMDTTWGPDGLYDIEIYESASEEDYHGGEDEGSYPSGQGSQVAVSEVHRRHLPEDEPWPGIEDQENRMQGPEDIENVDPSGGDEEAAESQASSLPSEYPSNQIPAQEGDVAMGFEIHEDF